MTGPMESVVLAVAGALEMPSAPFWWLHEAVRAQFSALGLEPERAFMAAWPLAVLAQALGWPGTALRGWWLGRGRPQAQPE